MTARRPARACVICGCTDAFACRSPLGPCTWVTMRPPMCSSCLLFLVNVRDADRVVAILEACGAPDSGGFYRVVRGEPS